MIHNLILKNIIVLLVLLINLIASLFYISMINNKKMKNGFYSLPVIIQKSYVLLFVGPLFISPFIPQSRYYFTFMPLNIPGILLSIAGLTFIVMSFFKIGVIPSIKSKSGLSTTGMYGIVRHPIYSGTIILFAGLILFQGSVIPSIYFPVSVLLYYLMTVFEEKDLVNIFGDEYTEYRKKVKKRILPGII